MLRFLALAYSIAIFLMISKVISSDESDEEVRRVARSFHRVSSSPLFFFHLLKLKKKIQQIENVPTTPPTADCICVPYYLCDANRTIIADGVGTVDIRWVFFFKGILVSFRVDHWFHTSKQISKMHWRFGSLLSSTECNDDHYETYYYDHEDNYYYEGNYDHLDRSTSDLSNYRISAYPNLYLCIGDPMRSKRNHRQFRGRRDKSSCAIHTVSKQHGMLQSNQRDPVSCSN